MEPGIEDAAVLERANERLALLLTGDKDFGELVYRDKLLTAGGVILVRLAGLLAETKAEIVSAAIREHGAEFAQRFGVISPGRVRIRATV